MAAAIAPGFSLHEFLREEREKDLFRFSTAGSVDDGKSTLIGRLLYDTQSIYDDQVRSIEGKGTTAPGQIDFALLTDGLRAEREQGITIDVAYRYFSTARRKFIIADTPGHEQYTRNMATGASTADAAVVLIDASKGVLVQSRRHAYIASLLRVRHLLVAVNKMDLAGYDETVFEAIQRDFKNVLDQIAGDTGTPVDAVFIPVSALAGDNIVHRSTAMPWYSGPSLLELLESLPSSQDTHAAPFRLPVQRVLRPDHTFRGFSGQIASGTVRPGDTITVLPSGRSAEVERIVTWDGDLDEAYAPLSVTLVLNQELDISRGDLIVSGNQPAAVSKSIEASVVWMDQQSLDRSRRYLLKHTSRTIPAFVSAINHRTNIVTLAHEAADTLEMNSIGAVTLSLLQPAAFDFYRDSRSTGAFILIDPSTNGTVAAGMITGISPEGPGLSRSTMAVTLEEKAARWGHRGGVLAYSGPARAIDRIERYLFESGAVAIRIENSRDEALTRSIAAAGLVALDVALADGGTFTVRSGDSDFTANADDIDNAIPALLKMLVQSGLFVSTGKRGDR